MSEKAKIVLKTKFEAGQIPSEEDFGDLLDSSINKVDDQIAIRNIGSGPTASRYVGIGSVDPESPLSIRNRGKKQNLVGFEDADGNEKWQIQIDPEKGEEGLNIKAKESDNANLFIQSEGKVGVGTKRPDERLHVEGKVKAEEFIGKVDWENISNVPMTNLVPDGVILMWSGSIDTIPDGWTLCDGENGTPDLRNRFIVGVSDKYDQGDIGGLDEVKLSVDQMPKHDHNFKDPGHSHSFTDTFSDGTTTRKHGKHSDARAGLADIPDRTSKAKTDITFVSQGKGLPHENRPPYYALCFIMKLYETTN